MCPVRVLTSAAVETSHIRTVLSSEAVARYLESEEKATSETPCVWPRKMWSRVPSVTDQVRAVLSAEAVARSVPSLENFTAEIARLWPVRVLVSV